MAEFHCNGRTVKAFRLTYSGNWNGIQFACGDWLVEDGQDIVMSDEKFKAHYGIPYAMAGNPDIGEPLGFGTPDDPRNKLLGRISENGPQS